MNVILNGKQLEEVDCFKYLGSQVVADGGCERDVVHRMNEWYSVGSAEKYAGQWGIEDKGQVVSMCRSNCTNGVVQSRGMGYKKF